LKYDQLPGRNKWRESWQIVSTNFDCTYFKAASTAAAEPDNTIVFTAVSKTTLIDAPLQSKHTLMKHAYNLLLFTTTTSK